MSNISKEELRDKLESLVVMGEASSDGYWYEEGEPDKSIDELVELLTSKESKE